MRRTVFATASRLILSVMVLAIAGCAALEPQPSPIEAEAEIPRPPFYLRASLDDPFNVIDQATYRVGTRELAEHDAEPTPEADAPDFWRRVVDRFEFADCPDGSRASQWAQWFGDRPDYMDRVLGRAHVWAHDIASEIEARDLPGELLLLPIVESAYDPFAYSHGRASGAWQFLSGTARDHGLVINEYYDGRRDVYSATRAALSYLEYLADRFDGDWNLALAAYNGGQGRVARAIRRNRASRRSTAWHELRLPRETLAYVPKLNGLGCLFREPERYGFDLPRWNDQPRIARVELPGPVDIVVLAARARLDLAELVALNAGLNGHLTSPSGPHHLIVPVDRHAAVVDVLPDMEFGQSIEWREIRVQRGDTLSELAQRYSTDVASLQAANNLRGDRLMIGQRLRLPSAPARVPDPAYAEGYRELASLQERLLPTRRFQPQVRPGESLWVIARQYGVSVRDLQRWNRLSGSNLIRPGQSLVIHMDQGGLSGHQSSRQYTVRRGDSLWLIARRHQVRLSDLLRWNDLAEDSVLRPGQTLTIREAGDA
ncbi:MAG: LysM peptidoglycan-binding domain-containing protein [Wenzhouxiangella sp.]|jgi:membrane-bound lytic murein transglycosylase D|nr:LysM peptidoglycan-binding domain-containing protein [Wenzhouxiangella sp.]